MSKEEPNVLTRMRLSCCWGDNLNEKELNDVVDYINSLQQENQQLKEKIQKTREYIDKHISYECDDVISGMRFCSHHLINDFRKEDLLEILKGDING